MKAELRLLLNEKEQKVNKLSLLREHVSTKLSIIEEQLRECQKAKIAYDKFGFDSIQACEIAAYGLSTLLSVSDSIRNAWDKDFEAWKREYADCSLPTLQ